ncbi:MAG: hypothetical protein HY784_06685 [Chloroflexi bacterium]|nr:hypothetical protein [Chloroflexota bacterium]
MLPSADLEARVARDYASARRRAFFRGLLALLHGRPNQLLAFQDVNQKLRLGGPIYRGVQAVPLTQIVGSVDRYRDFDREFLPTQSHTAGRWRSISRAWLGQQYIDAEVRECAVKVPVTPDLLASDLERMGEKVEFLERTVLDRCCPGASIELTILGGYGRLLEHIAVHKYFMGLENRRDITDAEAVRHWHEAVYLPVVGVIRRSQILEEFPHNTEADLYLWAMDHQHYLIESGQSQLQPPEQAAEQLLDILDQKTAGTPGLESGADSPPGTASPAPPESPPGNRNESS